MVLGFDLKAATGLSHTIVGELAFSSPCTCVRHTMSHIAYIAEGLFRGCIVVLLACSSHHCLLTLKHRACRMKSGPPQIVAAQDSFHPDYIKRKIVLAAATSAVASTVYGLFQTHPNDSHRPLVDFDLALTFIPALLLGVSFGVRASRGTHETKCNSECCSVKLHVWKF